MISPVSSSVISIDGVVVPPERATISVLDRGFLYGDGLFEVLRTWRSVPVDLDAHLGRMAAAAAALQLPLDRDRVTAAVHATLAAAGREDQRIRIVVTRGPGSLTARLGAIAGGSTIVIAEPLPAVMPTETSAAFVDWDVPARAIAYKSLAYLDSLIAKELAAARGADEALRRGRDGSVVEGATSNVFVVIDGEVRTPPLAAGILPGITRGHVLACCAEVGIAVAERALSTEDVVAADEVFVTSAVRGVVAVTRLDGHACGEPGRPVTQKLARLYAERMSRASIIH